MWRIGALLLIVTRLLAVDYYVSSTATGGVGSLADPWSLLIAFTNQVITTGDVIHLRGGTYAGNWYCNIGANTNGTNVIIKSYDNERALIQDGVFGDLRTELVAHSATTNIVIENSHNWQVGTGIIVGRENCQLNARSSPTNWTIVRALNGTAAEQHLVGSVMIARMPLITHRGSNVMFMDIAFTSVQATNRVITPGGSNIWYVSPGIDLDTGYKNSVVDCIFYNVGHPAIGYWDQGLGSVISGNIVYGTGFYDWNGASWTRGSPLYGQNSRGPVYLKNNIAFRNFTTGMEFFGETGPVRDTFFQENIFFDNPIDSIEAVSGSTATSNNWFISNWLMGSPLLSYTSLSNTHQFFYSNVVVNGIIDVKEMRNSAYTNNTILMPRNAGVGAAKIAYTSTMFNSNALNIEWDRNTYYIGDGSSRFNWDYETADVSSVNSLGGGNLSFDNDSGKAWTNWSRWDVSTAISTNWSTNLLVVQGRKLEYKTNRIHVVVINGDTNRTETTINVAALGFSSGSYELRDVQDYWNAVVGTHAGTITLPLNRTNASAISGTLTHATNEHSNVDYPGLFNAFVLDMGSNVRGKKIHIRKP